MQDKETENATPEALMSLVEQVLLIDEISEDDKVVIFRHVLSILNDRGA
jgi:hypothetical protein